MEKTDEETSLIHIDGAYGATASTHESNDIETHHETNESHGKVQAHASGR
jgi:hypothetical protein